MVDEQHVRSWVEDYRRAWESNDPNEITALFTEDAAYYPRPYATPWKGHEEILAGWLRNRDGPGATTFEWQQVSLAGAVAVVRGTTAYKRRTFSNLWVVRLAADGRASEFTEWWMQHPASGR
jgi:uncharacterized protein (TIGR02246 family)